MKNRLYFFKYSHIIYDIDTRYPIVYTVYIVKEAKPVTKPVVYYYSSNDYLKSLEIEGYEIEFDRNTNEYKITLGKDFLNKVRPYRIQNDRIMININHQTLIIPKC